MLMTDIHVRSFTGNALKPYLHSIAKLRMEVFREYPYFEEPDLEKENKYLKKAASSKESIAVLIFDGTTLVGASLGLPLILEEVAILKPFKERNLDIESYFFFGDSALLRHYRGRGIGHHFFDARESHIKHYKKFKHICFCVPEPLNPPPEFVSLNDFWRKRGYIHHPDFQCTLSWIDLGATHSTEKRLSFWMKDL